MRRGRQVCRSGVITVIVALTVLSLLSGCASMTSHVPSAEPSLERLSLPDISERLRRGELTSEGLVRAYLERIRTLDDRGPKLSAVTWINPHAVAAARRADRLRRQGQGRGILHGIPFLVKDNIDIAGVPTTAGSSGMANALPAADAPVVQRLKAAGAIVLGKTNMSELALSYGWLGYSSTGGLTRNPYRLTRNVSGSSSGSAAAVAARFAPFALGTDTAGSIRAPASTAGLAALKPTRGLFPLDGIVPLSPTLDVVGPMAATAGGLVPVMAALVNGGPASGARKPRPEDFTAVLESPVSLKHVRLGVVQAVRSANPDLDKVVERTLGVLSAAGAEMVPVSLEAFAQSQWPVMARIIRAEFRRAFEAYLGTLARGPRTLQIVIERSEEDGRINPARLEALRDHSAYRAGQNDPAYREDLKKLNAVRQRVLEKMNEEKLDALIFPTMACPASPLHTESDLTYRCRQADPYVAGYVANITGLPEATLPAGVSRHGLPLGISLLGRPRGDPELLAIAVAVEQTLGLTLFPHNLGAGK